MFKSTVYIAIGLMLSVLLGVCVSKIIANYYPYQYLGYLGIIKTYTSSFVTLLMFGVNFSYFFHHKKLVVQEGLSSRTFNGKNFNFILINSIIGGVAVALHFLVSKGSMFSGLVLIAMLFAISSSFVNVFKQSDSVRNYFKRYILYLPLLNIVFLCSISISKLFNEDLLNSYFYVGVASLVFLLFLLRRRTQSSFFCPDQISVYLSFHKDNFKIAKFFFLHALINSLILCFISYVVLHMGRGFLTEFEAYRQISNFAIYFQTIIGVYLFPNLIKNSASKDQHIVNDVLFFVLMLLAILYLVFFDKIVWVFYKKDFISLTLAFYFLLNSQILSVISTPYATKYQADLKFAFIYKVSIISALPVITYLTMSLSSVIAFNFNWFAFLYFVMSLVPYIVYSYCNRTSVAKYSFFTCSYVLIFFLNLKFLILK